MGIHVHVAEGGADQRDARARYGVGVVERLAGAGALRQDALLAHCVHVDGAEIAHVEDAGATVVCNPRSNMNNGVGHSPFNHRSGRVALGTDGIDGNMLAEAQAGFFRCKEADLGVAPDWPLVRLAESARFAGRCFGEPLLGTLRAGAPADVIVLDGAPPTPLDAGNLAGHLTFGLAGAKVRDVVVAGELVVADRRPTRLDAADVAAVSRRQAELLWERLDDVPAHDYAPEERPR